MQNIYTQVQVVGHIDPRAYDDVYKVIEDLHKSTKYYIELGYSLSTEI